MSDTTQRHNQRFSMAMQCHANGPSALLLGGTCVTLGVLCLGVVFWNGDHAVQSGAVLLGVSLGASGIIALLAGDRKI